MRRRRGLMSNYFDHLFTLLQHCSVQSDQTVRLCIGNSLANAQPVSGRKLISWHRCRHCHKTSELQNERNPPSVSLATIGQTHYVDVSPFFPPYSFASLMNCTFNSLHTVCIILICSANSFQSRRLLRRRFRVCHSFIYSFISSRSS